MYHQDGISNRRRFAIFEKYSYICQLCGNYCKGDAQLHHITPRGCGGSNSTHNLTVLCKSCHKYIHSGSYNGPLLKLRKKRW